MRANFLILLWLFLMSFFRLFFKFLFKIFLIAGNLLLYYIKSINKLWLLFSFCCWLNCWLLDVFRSFNSLSWLLLNYRFLLLYRWLLYRFWLLRRLLLLNRFLSRGFLNWSHKLLLRLRLLNLLLLLLFYLLQLLLFLLLKDTSWLLLGRELSITTFSRWISCSLCTRAESSRGWWIKGLCGTFASLTSTSRGNCLNSTSLGRWITCEILR